MSAPPRNRIERRLAEIERDLGRVRKTERAVRRGRAPSDPAPPPTEPPPPPVFPPEERDPDLFSHALARNPATAPGPSGKEPRRDRNRFTKYLASGGLMGLQPLRRDRAQVRNRALGMLLIVLLVGFSLWRILFRARPAAPPDRPPAERLR